MRWNSMNRFAGVISPAICAALMALMLFNQRNMPGPGDSAAFHAKARQAIAGIPLTIDPWLGTEQRNSPQDALDLLKPNAIRTICYVNSRADSLTKPTQRVLLNVVQCEFAMDMYGHWPRQCYPAIGEKLLLEEPRDWTVDGLRIEGMEYQFERVVDGRTFRRSVYNFMVVPGRGIMRDMNSLLDATEDYQQRYLGATQFQIVFDAVREHAIEQPERDEIFTTLMNRVKPTIETLKSGA